MKQNCKKDDRSPDVSPMKRIIDFLLSKKMYIYLCISGILTGLTLIFPVIGFLEWITLVPAIFVLLKAAHDRKIKLRNLYVKGIIFFYSFFLTCFHWFVYLYPLDFIYGMSKLGALAVVILAWFGLSLLQALISALSFVLVGFILRGKICERIQFAKPFVIASLWVIFEWFQTIGWWGVPWGRLPIGQSAYLVGLQNASLFGSYFVTFMLVAVNSIIAYIIITPKKLRLGATVAIALLLFQYGSGTVLWLTKGNQNGEKITVACVQGNIPSGEKWDNSSIVKTLDNYTKYTVEAAERGAKLVVWPETAFPYVIDEGFYSIFSDSFSSLAKNNDIYILVGAYVTNDDGDLLNSLICFTPNGEMKDQVYSKRHLVPFGEYVPMKPIIQTVIPPLAELVLSTGEIYAGKGAQIIELDDGTAVGGLICFDSIYETLTLDSIREGAELICLATNDSWFTDSRALNMHNAQAQIRAIEGGRYIARAANTGISTVISSRGEVLVQLEPLVEGEIVCDVYTSNVRTLWSYIGNLFVYILILLTVFVIVSELIFKKKMLKIT